MKKLHKILFVIGLSILWLGQGYALAQDQAEPDTSNQTIVSYDHVDVVIDYGWGDPERISNVHAEVILLFKKATKVVIDMPLDQGKYTIALIHGVKVHLYDHSTGKLIKTYESVLYS
ncbi:MAG TPA: hypothetical protein PKV71_11400 [Calditrichia bacterium]|nr:hypothetical protein [Calditrichota bacterium]HQU73316.1 hypothetical protein [Calditrichia bacterium]HQV32477.1 hypothetical protein [Calditrichia bacterium]